MRVLDPGHVYVLPDLDGGAGQRLTFVKREGPGFPGNVGSHPGTTCQEVLRALIERVEYLDRQIPCSENVRILDDLRDALWAFECRAAFRHGRADPPLQGIAHAPVCGECGHVGCTNHCGRH